MKHTKKTLYAIPVPEITRTYTPIPYKQIIQSIEKAAIKQGFKPVKMSADTTEDGNIMTGWIDLKEGIRIFFEGSYSKQLRTRTGGGVNYKGVGSLQDAYAFDMKHTTGVREDFEVYIDQTSAKWLRSYENGLKLLDSYSASRMGRQEKILLTGELFWKDVITGQQLKMIKAKLKQLDHLSQLQFVTTILKALEISHPKVRMQNYIDLVNYL